jgi:hypothetical protein
MIAETTSSKAYCNCLAMERGLRPSGHAGDFQDAFILEAPLPWKLDMMQRAGALPQTVIDLLALWLQEYYDGKGYPHRPLVVAPDPDYSREGFRRVMFYTRPAGLFAEYEKTEYCVPETDAGELIWAWYQDRDELPRFEQYRTPEADATRDILICTHGTVDAACAKFGYPLYKYMRDHCANDTLRVWRVSHFGGHVFAPTLMDMPHGGYWAYIDKARADRIAKRSGAVSLLDGHYRGWAGVEDGFMQAAEDALWQMHGWDWFKWQKSGEIIATDSAEPPSWADVRIRYMTPQGETGAYTVRVEVQQYIETIVTTGDERRHCYPQYVAAGIAQTSGPA